MFSCLRCLVISDERICLNYSTCMMCFLTTLNMCHFRRTLPSEHLYSFRMLLKQAIVFREMKLDHDLVDGQT